MVHVEPKFLAKPHAAKSLSKHFAPTSVTAGILPTPAVKGVVIHDSGKSVSKSTPVVSAVQALLH